MLSRYREGFVHKVYGSEKGIGAPDRPVNRRDKNVRKWYLSIVRHGLYLLDALHLVKRDCGEHALGRRRHHHGSLHLRRAGEPAALESLTRIFVRLVAAFVPKPDVAYLLDADPEAARARKPEYPVDFLHRAGGHISCWLALLGCMTVIPPLPLSEAKREVENAMADVLAIGHRQVAANLDTASAL